MVEFFIFGTIVGSFLNVCIYRMPLGQSVIRPRSYCPQCRRPIPWRLNIPILSWIVLRGRTACCRSRLSLRYPFVELLTGTLFALLWRIWHAPMAVAYMGFIGLLIVGTFVDWEHMVIPDGITVGGLILGLGCSLVYPALHGETKAYHSLVSAFKSMLFGSGLILWIAIFAEIIFRKEAMGMGDVKLMGCIGAFLGIEGCVFALFGGSCIGTAYYVPQLLYGRIVRGSIPSNVVPFGPFLSLASVVYLLGANVYVKNYFEQVRMLLEGP